LLSNPTAELTSGKPTARHWSIPFFLRRKTLIQATYTNSQVIGFIESGKSVYWGNALFNNVTQAKEFFKAIGNRGCKCEVIGDIVKIYGWE